MDYRLVEEIVARAAAGERFAVGLLAHVQGSAPQKPGARLIVQPDGKLGGTIGGGCLEMEARRRALNLLPDGGTERFELRLDDDFGWDDGLICGGKTLLLVTTQVERMVPALGDALAIRARGERCRIETALDGEGVGETICLPDANPPVRAVLEERERGRWLVEGVRPDPTLVVCGCGHIGASLVSLSARLGFTVVAVDDRPEYASATRLPDASTVLCEDLPTAAAQVPTGPDTYWVIVTRGHRNDGKVLANIIGRETGYLGMIGSRRKVRLIKEGLREAGVAEVALARVHAPIGLAIGAETPDEIALSIAAQLVQIRRLG